MKYSVEGSKYSRMFEEYKSHNDGYVIILSYAHEDHFRG